MLLHFTLGIWKIMDPLENVIKYVDPHPINRKCPAPSATKPTQGSLGTPGTQVNDGEGTELHDSLPSCTELPGFPGVTVCVLWVITQGRRTRMMEQLSVGEQPI